MEVGNLWGKGETGLSGRRSWAGVQPQWGPQPPQGDLEVGVALQSCVSPVTALNDFTL